MRGKRPMGSMLMADEIPEITFTGGMSVASDNSELDSIHESGPGCSHEEVVKEQLAHRETRAVFRLRVMVMMVLFLAATAVCVVVYYITRRAQIDEFQSQYSGTAEKLLDAFRNIVEQKLGAISAVGVATIAHGVDHARFWPFVTLSSFQQRCATARSLSDALFVSINPFVNESQRIEWEEYVVSNDSYWIGEGFTYQEQLGLDFEKGQQWFTGNSRSGNHSIFFTDEAGQVHHDPGPGPYMAVWETSPVLKRPFINQNLFRNTLYAGNAQKCLESERVIIGEFHTAVPGGISHPNNMTSFYATLLSIAAQKNVDYEGDPMSNVFVPVFSNFESDRRPVAVLLAVIHWAAFLKNVLPPNVQGVVAVLDNGCDPPFTYMIDGENVHVVGSGDLHDSAFDGDVFTASFLDSSLNIADGTKFGLDLSQDDCPIRLRVYPSRTFSETYEKNTPFVVTFSVAMVFVFTFFMFLLYDRLVERRQHIVLSRATTTTAIVSSLFPKNVRDRLMQERQDDKNDKSPGILAPNHRLKTFLSSYSDESSKENAELQPIADFFPHCTVMFADIAGFTAWSSTREPVQVFILLQTLYQAFDVIAKRHKVWKVETIGDSYVAVTGLPHPQERHAVIMARFSAACMLKMLELTSELEKTLGPDTGELSMRLGLHSGPVTAGVLRGDRARFQLFGDTVNTAARMESTGKINCIQCSQATADLLIQAGKEYWIRPRKDPVHAKGKGKMNTYWVCPFARKGDSASSSQTAGSQNEYFPRTSIAYGNRDLIASVKQDRLVDWICELLREHIKVIMASKSSSSGKQNPSNIVVKPKPGQIVLDEIAESIALPEFDPRKASEAANHQSVEVDEIVCSQLREFVSLIASSYRDNPFHNFEHACHVSMSVNKLLKRIVSPDVEPEDGGNNRGKLAFQIHDYTHGINSDPLTQLAIVLGALIHDADHAGISNAQLIKENKELAEKYKNKSVAEQHSFHIAWDLLMEDQFLELRQCLFESKADLLRFRQVLVNVVMATDIFDKELNDLRKKRWAKAFSDNAEQLPNINNLRATIVIEHLIQASDVSHTMQHWHVYRKWNKKLFEEMYQAFRDGRMNTDPSTFWYNGELGFFDNYIIPLAKKLRECKIFGVSSDEYLNYALQNRAEWQERGEEIVEEMKDEVLNPKQHVHSPRPRRRSSLGSCSVVDEEKKLEDMCLEVPLDSSRDTCRFD